ncbi:hypothetical protein Sjap_026269 [Stephania japonica]|uniref:Small RNA 2'-O-methyltransferase n=1 Tax=Stephania japonica TaxID=461633 RepID=A0AAP0HEW6_9MAGN
MVYGPMESVVKKPVATPKTIINLKYGNKALYRTEEVKEPVQNGCPGLSIQQHVSCLFRCCLQLPEFTVTSEPFKRKKDAEQSAAKLALEKLGIDLTASNFTTEQAWDELVARVSFLFSNESYNIVSSSLFKFLSSSHPLTGHFKEAIGKKDPCQRSIPVSILAACDSKLNNLCKSINSKSESDIQLNVSLIMQAAGSSSVSISEGRLSLWRQMPHSPEAIQGLLERYIGSAEGILIKALYIPSSMEKPVRSISLNISSSEYYMDIIAHKLGAMDASQLLVSRVVGKASSEMRLYFCAPKAPLNLIMTSDVPQVNEAVELQPNLNGRACYFSGQIIHGDAVMAAIGFTWKSPDLFHEDISLGTYYRFLYRMMLIGRLPDGGYKLSREAILAADLPVTFTRSNWRGTFPRDLLCAFCRQNWLSEPELSTVCMDGQTNSPKMSETCKKLKSSKPDKIAEFTNGNVASDTNGHDVLSVESAFRCEVKILSRNGDLIMECSSEDTYRKQSDALQNAALKALLWLSKNLKQKGKGIDKSSDAEDILGIHVNYSNLLKEFELFSSIHAIPHSVVLQKCNLTESSCMDQLKEKQQDGLYSLAIEGPESSVCPSNGSLVCISYHVSLIRDGEFMKETLERSDEYEFEVGAGAVIPQIEACVNQMSLNQSAHFFTVPPHPHLLLAAYGDITEALPPLSSSELAHPSFQNCCLEFSITLLRVTEPLENRMEEALFSPSLSKQRVEYALKHINESGANNLVDFGCGSGSLLESLMDYPTALQKMVGVDISKKSLSRAAKVLHSKLSALSDHVPPSTSIKSAQLYDGSILSFDHRLYRFDIGTCLEVIEHMEEYQAHLFGDVVLGSFCPSILIVSTPNYEYNPILQRTALPNQPNQTEEGEDKNQLLPCRFRNHDHKFEWTREQFHCWATGLASRNNYSVEFSGVGGSGDQEPGFASQVAVFRKDKMLKSSQNNHFRGGDSAEPYELIWEWPISSSQQFLQSDDL